jgi:hypothetical protein
MRSIERPIPALDDAALALARRVVWAICLAVYLTVFIGGIQAGGAELITLARATGVTLVAAWLGKTALGLLERASLPVPQVPLDTQEGTLGSLGDLVSSANVAQQVEGSEAA